MYHCVRNKTVFSPSKSVLYRPCRFKFCLTVKQKRQHENVNKYNVEKVMNRFNNIFPYIETGDHFMDKYSINVLKNNKYI